MERIPSKKELTRKGTTITMKRLQSSAFTQRRGVTTAELKDS